MKFVKSKFAQKLIIILIALMIFNIAVPKEVSAWDLGGILLKPITAAILATLVSIDVSIGIILNGLSIGVNAIGGIIEIFSEDNAKTEALNDISTALTQLFIGPDSIFAGNVRILDANIFEVESFTTTKDFYNKIINSGLVENVNELADATSPGYDLIVKLKEGIATTYRVLRDICGYIMLAGLIFTGIRILVSSNIPTKKTQYLMLLQDWFIGMALLIFSHVIMIGVFYISDTLVDALALSLNGVGGLNFNLIIQCLFSFDSAEQIICLIMLGYLIYLTIIFAISYFKRLMWICVLIVIAPIVSIMYAFGNATKGIYSKWLREYITTVLVQPFHIVVYYVLVSIPLNISNSTGGFSLASSNFFEIVYCLVALSFIRPAEKYIRDLFGMGQGIVSQASFDSGKQTLDKAVKATVTVAATAATAGVGGAAMAAVKSGSLVKGLAGASKSLLGDGTLGKSGKVVIDWAEKGLETGGKIADRIFNGSKKSDAIDAGVAANNVEDEGQQAGGASAAVAHQNSKNPIADARKELLEEQLADGQITEDDLTNDEKQLLGIDNKANIAEEEVEKANELANDNANLEKNSNDTKNINASNVIISAGNISMQGQSNTNHNEKGNKDSTEDAKEKLDKEKEEIDENLELQEGNGKVDDNRKRTWREKVMDGAEQSVDDISSFMKVATGQKGVFDALSDMNQDSKLGQLAGQFMDSDLGKSLKKFEDLGGMKELHQGVNEVRDTFYVTPPPGDWKETNARMDSAHKEKIEQEKFNFVNNEGNQNFIIEQKGYIEKFRKQYPDKTKYPDAYIQNLAKEKAKSDLKSLADTYVTLGVTDVKEAYECNEDRKDYGITAQQAVQLRMEFERFDNDTSNVSIINNNSDIYGKDNNKVSDGISNARDYYNNGYRNINDMAWVDQLALRMKDLPQFARKPEVEKKEEARNYAIKVDQVLRKKGGKLNYKGDNADIAKMIEDINKHYEQ